MEVKEAIPRRYTCAEVAKCYGVNARCVNRWIKEGRLNAVRIGNRYYITADNGDVYCLYYVKSDGSDNQALPIPRIASEYQISGNNIDGFIISALVGHKQK